MENENAMDQFHRVREEPAFVWRLAFSRLYGCATSYPDGYLGSSWLRLALIELAVAIGL